MQPSENFLQNLSKSSFLIIVAQSSLQEDTCLCLETKDLKYISDSFFLPLLPPAIKMVGHVWCVDFGVTGFNQQIPFLLDAVLQGQKQINLQKGKPGKLRGRKRTLYKHQVRSERPQIKWQDFAETTSGDSGHIYELYVIVTRNPRKNPNPAQSYGKTEAHENDSALFRSREALRFSSTYV